MVKFSDSSHNILREYFDVLVTPRSGTHNSFIQGQRRTISAQGGLDTILYQKNDSGVLIGHKFLIQLIDGDNFKFQHIEQVSDNSEATELAVDQEMYFRKDSLFHDWLRVHATQYEQALNTNKTFIYFGKLYSISGEESLSNYNIIFDGLKNWAEDSLPEQNRTEKIVELLKVFFDEAYQDVYNMTKTLWSFFDAREVDIDHLNYMATRANIETDVEKIDTELKLREFVDTLPWWLKRKGSYSSYLSLFKLLLGNTKNKLNFYERWTEWCLKELRSNDIIQNSDFDDHHYIEFYGRTPTGGAGPFYYSQFDHNNYPNYTDTAPVEENCLENTIICQLLTDFTGFSGEDTGGHLTQAGYNIQVDGFNPASGEELYLFSTPAVSATDFGHCLTVSMDSTSQPSGGVFIWAVSDHEDATLDEHETANENYLGITFELLGDAPSGSVTGRRFKLWSYDDPTMDTRESSASYSADTEYFLSIEKNADELNLKTYSNEGKRDQDLIEKIRLPLTENKGYNTIYILNYKANEGGDWTGDIYNWYTAQGNTNSLAITGSKILSPHYRVEIDLTSEPMGDDFIIHENQATELIRYWEYLKPVSKFVHYNWLLSPIGQIDRNSKSIPLYSVSDTAFCNTQFIGQGLVSGSSGGADLGPDADYYENLYTEEFLTSQFEWIIRHNLGSQDLIIQTYDKDNFQTWPKNHNFFDLNRVDIDWSAAERGSVFVAELKDWNYSHFQTSPASAWNITHNLGTSGASGVVFEIVSVSGASDVDLTESTIQDTHFDLGPTETWTRYFGTSAWTISGGWEFNESKNAYTASASNGKTFAILEAANWNEDFRTGRVRLTFTTSGAGIPSGSWIMNGDPESYQSGIIGYSNNVAQYTVPLDSYFRKATREKQSYFNPPYDGIWNGSGWDSGDSYDGDSYIMLEPSGSWIAGYRPRYCRITFAPGGDAAYASLINNKLGDHGEIAYVYFSAGDTEAILELQPTGIDDWETFDAGVLYTWSDGPAAGGHTITNIEFYDWTNHKNRDSQKVTTRDTGNFPSITINGTEYFLSDDTDSDSDIAHYAMFKGVGPWTEQVIIGGGSLDTFGLQDYFKTTAVSGSIAFRFENINIAQGATINSATMKLYAEYQTDGGGLQSGPATVHVYGLDEDAGDIPASLAEWKTDVASNLTVATVLWEFQADTGFDTIGYGTSPDLSNVIQEIVNRPGWSANNELVIYCLFKTIGEFIADGASQAVSAHRWNPIAESSIPAVSEEIILTEDTTDWWYDEPGDIHNLRFKLLPANVNSSGASGVDYYMSESSQNTNWGFEVSAGNKDYYFTNDFDSTNWTNTTNAVDGSIGTAATAPALNISSLGVKHGIGTYGTSGTKEINKVYFRVYGDNPLGAGCDARAIFPAGNGDIRNIDGLSGNWSSWFDITNDTNAPTWSWAEFARLGVWFLTDIQGAGETYDVMKVEARAEYTQELPDNIENLTDGSASTLTSAASSNAYVFVSAATPSGAQGAFPTPVQKIWVRTYGAEAGTPLGFDLIPYFGAVSGSKIDLTSHLTKLRDFTPWLRIDNDPQAPSPFTESDINELGFGLHFKGNPSDAGSDRVGIGEVDIRTEETFLHRDKDLTEYQLRNIEFFGQTVSAGKITFDTMPRRAESFVLLNDRGIQPEFEFWFNFSITSAGRGIENIGGEVGLLTVSDSLISDIRDLDRLPSGSYAVSMRARNVSGDMYVTLSDHGPSASFITDWNVGGTSYGDTTSIDQLFVKFLRRAAWGESSKPAIIAEYYPDEQRISSSLIYRQVHFLGSNRALIANDYLYALQSAGQIPSASDIYAYGPSASFESNYTIFSDRSGDSYDQKYDDEWETTPENMVDGSLTTFAQEEASHAWQEVYELNDIFSLPLERTIDSVKLRAHGLAGGPPRSWDLQPRFMNTPTSATYYYDTYRAGFDSSSDNAVDGLETTFASAWGGTTDEQEIVFISHTASGDTPLTGEITQVAVRFFGSYGTEDPDNLYFEAFFDGTQIGNSQWGLTGGRWTNTEDNWTHWINVSDEVPGPGWGANPSQKGIGWTWDDLLNLDFKITYDGNNEVGPEQNWARVAKAEIRVMMAGEYYRLKDNSIPLTNTAIIASAGLNRMAVYGLKPGKPMRKLTDGITNRDKPGVRNGYHSAFDNDGNFWIGSLSSKTAGRNELDNAGIFHKCLGTSSWIRTRYEPSAAKLGGGILDDTYPFRNPWYPQAMFWNSSTERICNVLLNDDTEAVRVIEYDLNSGDYPNQLLVAKDTLLSGTTFANFESINVAAHEPVTNSYILGTYQSAGNPWYSFNATTGVLNNKRTFKHLDGCWGVATSGGKVFLFESGAAVTPWISVVDPLTLGAADDVSPSAINFTWRGNGYGYGDLAINPINGRIYSGYATGTEWLAHQKWTRNALIDNTNLDYSAWIDITNDVNAPETWGEDDVNNITVNNIFFENEDNDADSVNYARTTQIELQVNYSPSGVSLPASGATTITGYSQDWQQVYESNPVLIMPATAEQVTPNDLKLTFSGPIDGKCFIRDDDYFHQQTTAAETWNINHNLNVDGAIVMCYDTDNKFMMPISIELVDANNTQIIFNEAVAGTAVFVVFQGTFIGSDYLTTFAGDPPGYWKAGDGGNEVGFEPLGVNDINNILVSGGLDEFTTTTSAASGFVLINFEVPKAGAYQFNEFGIFDSNKDIHYYTKCSDIYKPDGVSLNMRYRIAQTPIV